MSCDPQRIVIHQGFELAQEFYFESNGFPENTTQAEAWQWIIFHPISLREFVVVEGEASYVAPDPANDVAGYGKVTFPVPADATEGQTWKVGQFKIARYGSDGSREIRMEGRLRHSLTPPVEVPS